MTIRPSSFRVLVFTKHQGYSHRSIPAAVAAMHTLGARHGFTVLATDDANLFVDDALRAFSAVIFLNTTGDILSEEQKAAAERYVHAGGGSSGSTPPWTPNPGGHGTTGSSARTSRTTRLFSALS